MSIVQARTPPTFFKDCFRWGAKRADTEISPTKIYSTYSAAVCCYLVFPPSGMNTKPLRRTV